MIRDAVVGYAETVAAIWNAVIRDTAITFASEQHAPDAVAAMIAARPGFLVAEDADGVAGFATWGPFRGGSGYVRTVEHSIYLAPRARGRGLGRAILDAAAARATAQGAHVMVGGLSSGNPGGRAFHLACGFVEAGVLREVGWKFGQWWDLHLLTRRLGGPA